MGAAERGQVLRAPWRRGHSTERARGADVQAAQRPRPGVGRQACPWCPGLRGAEQEDWGGPLVPHPQNLG